jgi:hypothetical protein
MSSVSATGGLPELNERGRRPRLRWRSWLGILSLAVLLVGFCLWVYAAIKSNDDAHCREAAADVASDTQTTSADDSGFDNSTASDDGDVCLVRWDAVAR